MESVHHLSLNQALSSVLSPSIHIPAAFISNFRPVTKIRSNNFFLSLSSTSFHHRQFVTNINGFSKPLENDDKGEKNVVRKAVAAASLVLVCATGISWCSFKMMNPKAAIAGPNELSQKAPPLSMMSEPRIGGKRALNSFLGMSVKLTSNEEEPSYWPGYRVPPGPSMKDVEDIKVEAIRKIKSGEPELAVNLLRAVYKECMDEPEPAYHIEMALVEILISLGRYEEALNCNCLQEEAQIPSDSRYQLYKAILYTMLDKEEARKWWEEFAETIEVEDDPTIHIS